MYEIHPHKSTPFPKHLCLKIKIVLWKQFDIKFLEEKFKKWKTISLVLPMTPQKQAQRKIIGTLAKREVES